MGYSLFVFLVFENFFDGEEVKEKTFAAKVIDVAFVRVELNFVELGAFEELELLGTRVENGGQEELSIFSFTTEQHDGVVEKRDAPESEEVGLEKRIILNAGIEAFLQQGALEGFQVGFHVVDGGVGGLKAMKILPVAGA